MTADPKQLDKNSKSALRELSKLCDKAEKLCVPIQRVLLHIANLRPQDPINQRVERFQSRLAIVNAALHQLDERAFQRGGSGLRRQATRGLSKLKRAAADDPARPADKQPALSGRCPEFPLVSVLMYLINQKSSGTLKIRVQHEVLSFELFDGDVVYSTTDSPRRGERLGEILIENGDVKMTHFMAFIDSFRSQGQLLGMALVENGIVTEEALTSALIEQMQLRFDRVFEAESCSFEFFAAQVSTRTGLHINVKEFLTETGRRQADLPPDPDYKHRGDGQPGQSGLWYGAPSGGWNSPETK